MLLPARGGSVPAAGRRTIIGLGLISVVALVYTAPWDGYLISRGVWGYGAGRVVGAIGGVPVEEYLFFVLQPLLTGLWLHRLLSRGEEPKVPKQRAHRAPRLLGTVFWLCAGALGFFLLERGGHTLYPGLILTWASPVLAAQWAYGGTELWRLRRNWFLGMAVPTFYLWFADDAEIHLGIWHVSEQYTTGLRFWGSRLRRPCSSPRPTLWSYRAYCSSCGSCGGLRPGHAYAAPT